MEKGQFRWYPSPTESSGYGPVGEGGGLSLGVVGKGGGGAGSFGPAISHFVALSLSVINDQSPIIVKQQNPCTVCTGKDLEVQSCYKPIHK